jgi:hypothetical protein
VNLRPTAAPIWTVLAPGQTKALSEQLKTAGSNVAYWRARPGRERTAQVTYTDLLKAMGKKENRSVLYRGANDARTLALIWLAMGPVTDVVLLVAEDLPPGDLNSLACLTTAVGIRLWLIFESEPEIRTAEVLLDLGAQTGAVGDLPTSVSTGLVPPIPDELQASFPKVATAHPIAYLSSARDQLRNEEFARIFETFAYARDCVREQLSIGVHDSVSFSPIFSSLIGATTDIEELECMAAGALFGALQSGYLLKIDLAQFITRGVGINQAVQLSNKQWATLGQMVRPMDAALCALASLPIANTSLTDLLPTDIAPDGSWVHADGIEIPVPEPARALLLAQLLFYRLSGETGQLLSHGPKQKKVTENSMRRLLSELAKDSGIHLRLKSNVKTDPGNHWQQHLGISLQQIEELGCGSMAS